MAPPDSDEGALVNALDLGAPSASRRDDFYARDLDGGAHYPSRIIDVEVEPPELERAAQANDDAGDEGDDQANDDAGDEGDDQANDNAAAQTPRRPRRDSAGELRAALLEAAGARTVRVGRLPASLRRKGVTAGVFVYGPSTVVVLR